MTNNNEYNMIWVCEACKTIIKNDGTKYDPHKPKCEYRSSPTPYVPQLYLYVSQAETEYFEKERDQLKLQMQLEISILQKQIEEAKEIIGFDGESDSYEFYEMREKWLSKYE